MRLLAAILYFLAGFPWLVQFFGEGSIIKLLIAVLWLAGGASHIFQYIQSKKPPEEE